MSKVLQLLATLAQIFDEEGRPGGQEAAGAIRNVLANPDPRDLNPAQPLPGLTQAALAQSRHAAASAVLAAEPMLSWHASGQADGRIRHEISSRIVTTELIGRHAMYFHPTVRVGLFAQSAHTDYVTRRHLAEETFVMLGGQGFWQAGDLAPRLKITGDVIHHPSMTPHASVTTDYPFLAAWRWTGEIGYDGYELTG